MCKCEADNFRRPNVDCKRAFVLFLCWHSTCYLQYIKTVLAVKVRVCWLQNVNLYRRGQCAFFI